MRGYSTYCQLVLIWMLQQVAMLGVFSSAVVNPPKELVAAGSRSPSPKISANDLLTRFMDINPSAVSIKIRDHVHLAYTHHNQLPLQPRSFGVKDEIICLFEGVLHNLGSLKQEHGLAKSANEVVLVIEAYKALRARAPYPPNHMVGHLVGHFAFVVFDKSTSTLFVASDQFGHVPLYCGFTADGFVAFADDAELLKSACGKSLASFPQGCFFSTAVGELKSYGVQHSWWTDQQFLQPQSNALLSQMVNLRVRCKCRDS